MTNVYFLLRITTTRIINVHGTTPLIHSVLLVYPLNTTNAQMSVQLKTKFVRNANFLLNIGAKTIVDVLPTIGRAPTTTIIWMLMECCLGVLQTNPSSIPTLAGNIALVIVLGI